MNRKVFIIVILIILVACIGASLLFINSRNKGSMDKAEREDTYMIKLSVNDEVLFIKPEDNSSSKAFIEKLKSGEVVVSAEDYGNFEKVGDLGFSLPTNDAEITTEPGDVILYQGDKITLYYDTNTWTFTRLGKVQNVTEEELKQILGSGDVMLRFSLDDIEAD